jgi:hypothetical protein
VLQLKNSWVRYCFDGGIVWAGRLTEAKLSERNKDGSPKHTLQKLLADEPNVSIGKTGLPKISMGQMIAMGEPIRVKLPDKE